MMKKFLILLMTGMMILFSTGIVTAGYYEYKPWYNGDDDLDDLDHYKAYSWGVDASEIFNNNETIVQASLFFDNIRNWNNDPNVLHVSLWDISNTGELGVSEFNDSQNVTNYFGDSNLFFRMNNLSDESRDVHVTFNNDVTDPKTNDAVTWDSYLPDGVNDGATLYRPAGGLAKLINYASGPDGLFALGFDPDCHFYNSGITLKLWTTETPTDVIPEPATLMLFGTGLLCFASRMRKKKLT